MVFSINGTDYGGNIIAGSYNINDVDEYFEYKNGNGKTVKDVVATKVRGSFDMFFRTKSEFDLFATNHRTHKLNDSSVLVTLSVNNTGEDVSVYVFMDYTPVRNKDGMNQDYFERFTVGIEEV